MKETETTEEGALVATIIKVNRCAKVVKGGKRFSFSAIVVVGDKRGTIGVGLGKAKEVPDAIRKAEDQARKSTFMIPLNNGTIPHEVMGNFGAGQVLLKPASAGTGVIAGGAVRNVVEAAGVHDILTKSIGSSNPHNVVRATLDALRKLKDPASYKQMRLG